MSDSADSALLEPEDCARVVARLRTTFRSGRTAPLTWRRSQLAALRTMLRNETPALAAAMAADLGRPHLEGWMSDIALVDGAIAELERGLARWSRPRRVRVGFAQRPGRARIEREPLGVCLVVAPWNYPVQLLVLPLASALAAGNCVIAKPSELAPATSALLARLIGDYLDPVATAVVEGDGATTEALIAAGLDHVFFTGSSKVGRIVMESAARHLTSVTLELGGKSPAVVAADASLRLAARRIAFGKFLNAGQSCVAPDYVLVDEIVADGFCRELAAAITEFFGPDPAESPDFGRIVNDGHLTRIATLIDGAGPSIFVGGIINVDERYVAPTVVRDPSAPSDLLTEEIFGPVLPVISVVGLDSALAHIDALPAPLAIYCFTSSRTTARKVRSATRSGSFCCNTTVEQLAIPGLPFGGAGESGMGRYHGRAGFETFSRTRSVFLRPARFDTGIGYPPYSKWKRRILALALGGRGSRPPA